MGGPVGAGADLRRDHPDESLTVPTRYLHYIDQDGLASYRCNGGLLQFIARHAGDAEGLARFEQWLQAHRQGSQTLLANLADEGFQYDSIPHVSGADRKALLGRKLAQQFYGSPYVTSLSLGRENEGRRDERILFTGITRPAALDPWLQILQTQEAALTALYTPALLTHALLGVLRPEAPRGLIVSFSRAGIRQIYFDNGRLRFSRLSPAPEGDFSTWGDACLRESQKTLQYLSAQRWIGRNVQLPVWLLLARQDFAPLLASVERAEQLEFRLTNLDTLSRQIGQRDTPGNSDSQQFFMRLALRENNAPQLAPEASRRVFRFWQARRLILGLGLVGGCALALGALQNQLESRELQQLRQQHEASIRTENQHYQQLIASLPPLPAPLDTLRNVVASHERLSKPALTPLSALLPLSQSLDLYPDIELQRLEWELGEPAFSASAPPAQISLLLHAALPPSAAGDPRAAIQRIQAFAAELRPRVGELKLFDLPFDTESNKTLRSDAETLRKRPEFKLRLILRETRP